jgi:predicted ferric reductase
MSYLKTGNCLIVKLFNCCPLPIAHCLLSIVYRLSSIVYCLSSIVYCLLSIAYRLSSIVYCLLPIVYRLLSIVYCLLSIVYCLLITADYFFTGWITSALIVRTFVAGMVLARTVIVLLSIPDFPLLSNVTFISPSPPG